MNIQNFTAQDAKFSGMSQVMIHSFSFEAVLKELWMHTVLFHQQNKVLLKLKPRSEWNLWRKLYSLFLKWAFFSLLSAYSVMHQHGHKTISKKQR